MFLFWLIRFDRLNLGHCSQQPILGNCFGFGRGHSLSLLKVFPHPGADPQQARCVIDRQASRKPGFPQSLAEFVLLCFSFHSLDSPLLRLFLAIPRPFPASICAAGSLDHRRPNKAPQTQANGQSTKLTQNQTTATQASHSSTGASAINKTVTKIMTCSLQSAGKATGILVPPLPPLQSGRTVQLAKLRSVPLY